MPRHVIRTPRLDPGVEGRSATRDRGVILYDGDCILCSSWVRFVFERDPEGIFRFTPIQSPYGSALAARYGIDPKDPDTNAVVFGDVVGFRSDAALAVLSRLPGWRWMRFLGIVPQPLRDLVYRLVARNRYRLFGRRDACFVGDGRLRERIFLDAEAAS